MANIKVSELTTATNFGDNDYSMIIQNGESKKISGTNFKTSVLESGNNANGNYVKYSDGTLIQYSDGKVEVDINSSAYWDKSIALPMSFIDKNYFAICSNETNNSSIKIEVLSMSYYENSLMARIYNGTGTSYSVKFRWFAIGKWK